MEMEQSLFFVSGRVQCVGFRYHTQQQALTLNLSGYAKNLADGRVEVMVQGDKSHLEQLAIWLKTGPKTATVERVTRNRINEEQFNKGCKSEGFHIL